MTEPNKIFRSVCQEIPSHSDISFTRSYTYTMYSVPGVLKISLCILGFLLLAFSFTVFGLFLYPNLVGVCKSPISFEEDKLEDQNNGYYLPSLSEILSGLLLCKETNYQTLAEKRQLNISEINSSIEKGNHTLLNKDQCICTNSTNNVDTYGYDIKNGNGTSDINLGMVDKCICNETRKIGDFNTNETKFEAENNDIKALNFDKESQSSDFNTNEMDTVNGRHPLRITACDCQNTHTVNFNGTSEEGNVCKCPEKTRFYENETMSESEQQNDQPLEVVKCECPNMHYTKDTVNGSDSGIKNLLGKLTKDNECICPKTSDITHLNTSKTTNGSQKHHIEPPINEDAFNTVNFRINEKETVNESQHLSSEFVKDDNINFNETSFENKDSEVHYLKSEECECTENRSLVDIIVNGSRIRNKKLGIKNADGECICSGTHGIEDFDTNKITNGSYQNDVKLLNIVESSDLADSSFHETDSATEKQHQKSDKCICPNVHNTTHVMFNETNNDMHDIKIEGAIECKCPEVLEFDNFHPNETGSVIDRNMDQKETGWESDDPSLVSEKCECPGMPEMLDNESRNQSYMFGVKTVDGKCVCPETPNPDGIYAKKSETEHEKETSTSYEREIEKGKKIGHSNEGKTVKEKGMGNSGGGNTVKEKELTNKEKQETPEGNKMFKSGKAELGKGKASTNSDKTETLKEKELTKSNKSKTTEVKEPDNNGTETMNEKISGYEY